MPWYACLLATILVASVMPVDAVSSGEAKDNAVPPPTCTDTDNENGFGGTHVYCDYGCPKGALLNVGVAAHDNDATAAAWTDCGGQHADCDLGTVTCDGVSPGVTSSAGSDDCHGRSYEFSDSSVTVTCAALGANLPLCDLIPDLPGCDPQPECSAGLRCGIEIGQICVDSNPGLGGLGSDVLASMFPVFDPKFDVINLMTAYVSDGEGTWAYYEAGVCTAGTF